MQSRLLAWLLIASVVQPLSADDKPGKGDTEQRVEALVKQLGSASFEERERASKELIALADDALPRLISATKEPDLEIARRAEHCIKAIIGSDEKVDPLAAELLKNPEPKARWAAANKLMFMGSIARPAVPALIQALDDNDDRVRLQAARALEMVGPGATAAVPRLTRLLNDRRAHIDLRWKAAIVLSYIGRTAETAVPALLQMLEEKDAGLRNGAAQALGVLGRNHKDVVPALLRALYTKDANVVAPAATALGQIGKDPEHCVPAILSALNGAADLSWVAYDPRPDLMLGLAHFGPAAKPAIPTLVQIADNPKAENIQFPAILALAAIGPAARSELQALQKRYPHSILDSRVRRALKAVEAEMYPGKDRRSKP